MDTTLSFTDSLLMALAILAPLGTGAVAFLVLPRVRIPPGTFGSVAALCFVGLAVGIVALLGAAGLAPVPGGLIATPDTPFAPGPGQQAPQGAFTPLQLVMVAWIAASTSSLFMVGTWRAAHAARKAEEEAAAAAGEGGKPTSLFNDRRWN